MAHLMKKLPDDKRKAFVDHWKPKVAEHAAHIAETKGILHRYISAIFFYRCIDADIVIDSDLNMNNVK